MMNLEQAQEVRNSTFWLYIKDEIDYRISTTLNKLKTCNQEELPELQGDLKKYEEFKRLPDDVVDREE